MAHELVAAILRGEERAIARACRLIDDRRPGVRELLDALSASSRGARVIGVTGSPGAGKSSLISGLVAQYRALGQRVGVLAVDPSSTFTGGAILGDRVRMQRHFGDPSVFIRSLATRGAQGGLSRSVQEHVVVLDAAGYEVIVIETVGVGQDELDVIEVAESIVLVVMPGTGDDIQAVKSGILEIADVFVVNKADRDGADRAAFELEQRLELGRAVSASQDRGAWQPPVLKCVALHDQGLPELAAALARHRAWLDTPDGRSRSASRRRVAAERLLLGLVCEGVATLLAPRLKAAAARVAERELSPHRAAAELLDRLIVREVSES